MLEYIISSSVTPGNLLT